MNKEKNNLFWNKIRNIIKLYHLNFLSNVIGYDYLSEEEIKFLEDNFGKDKIEENKTKIPFLNKIFAFGQISQKIGLENSNKISKKDLNLWIEENRNSLTKENIELNKLKSQTYLDTLSKQFQIEKDLRQSILNESNKKEFKLSNIVNYIKSKFEDWSYFKDSISYISENALNRGKIEEIGEKDPIVYKVPIMDEKLCPHCKKAYLNRDGSPKLFRLSELTANGTNIGKKSENWLPTLNQMHINCRCLLQYFEEIPGTTKNDYEFDESKQRYILKEKILKDHKVERKSKVNIQIGNKNFEV